MTDIIHVAVGVILREPFEVLIAKRPAGKIMAGLWEFPGGKVEPGETIQQTLIREFHEELGITISAFNPFIEVEELRAEQDCHITLSVFLIESYDKEPIGKEGQELLWCKINELGNYQFPPTNQAIIGKIKNFLRIEV